MSIVCSDNLDKQKNFYPDYIFVLNNEIWIVEIKSRFEHSGNSQDIDIFTLKKFALMKDYLVHDELRVVLSAIMEKGDLHGHAVPRILTAIVEVC